MNLDAIAARRLRIVPVSGAALDEYRKAGWMAELTKLGYRITNPELLESTGPDLGRYAESMETLRAIRGGDVPYVPLFQGFPERIPQDTAHFARRIIGYLGNMFDLFEDGVRLENGTLVPKWLFDVTEFGTDPITQNQSRELFEAGKSAQEDRDEDSHVEWIDLELVPAGEVGGRLAAWLRDALYAKSSIKVALHDDIRALLKHFGVSIVDTDRLGQKETRALVLQAAWEAGSVEAVTQLASTPTDLLRLFAALTETDVSLSNRIKFPKMSRAQRRVVLAVLEASSSLPEDLNRFRGLWLEIGRYVHPGEHAERFPKTAEAFKALRSGPIPTFNSRTEALLAAGEFEELLGHLGQRPGVLARKVHELLRCFPEQRPAILDRFAEIALSLRTKNLLVLQAHFGSINDSDRRAVVNKRGKIKVLDNPAKGALTGADLGRLQGILKGALLASLAERTTWGGKRVWLQPGLNDFTVPLQQRAGSDGLIALGRGSRMPVDFDRVLRLFIYWKEAERTTDLDLSVIQFDENWGYTGHVSYTNLKGQGIAHSGDITSAPLGAAEFVDIHLSAIDPSVRYLTTQVYLYAGESFAQMTAHAGWMLRKHIDANVKSFDIKTVVNKFDLNGPSSYAMPLVVDLHEARMIWTDLYMGGKAFHNNVEGAHANVAAACREIARFTKTRPTLETLALLHLAARGGERVHERSDADITIGFGADNTVDLGNVERILAELL